MPPLPSGPDLPALLAGRRRILVTGGAGFIGGAVVRRLLAGSDAQVFNLDKLGYASDLTSIEQVLDELSICAGLGLGTRHTRPHHPKQAMPA